MDRQDIETAGPRGLGDFLGQWRLEREVTGTPGPARFAGLAEILPDGLGATYREAGLLTLAGGQGFRAERVYLWRPAPPGIAVLFDDGRPFHQIRLGPGPGPVEAEHLCGADLYRVRYDFACWPDWRAVWRVRGPAKDYRMASTWRRA